MSIDVNAPILVAVDGSPAAHLAACWAAREASSRGCRLVLLSVNSWPVHLKAPWESGFGWDVEGGRAIAGDVLEQARQGALAVAGDLEVDTEIIEGLPAQVLLERCARAVLIVLGRRGGGEFTSLLLGSSAAQVATHAECSVVVIPEVAQAPIPEGPGIVVGVDIGGHSQAAIGFAFEEASARALPLTAVRAWSLLSEEPAIHALIPGPDDLESEQRRLLSEALVGWGSKYPDVQVRPLLVRRHPGRALVEASEHASMLVVGARGAGGFPGLLLGSVPDAAIRHANCPVVIVR
jgi:nucleotide-binding universal stress UspA family protein